MLNLIQHLEAKCLWVLPEVLLQKPLKLNLKTVFEFLLISTYWCISVKSWQLWIPLKTVGINPVCGSVHKHLSTFGNTGRHSNERSETLNCCLQQPLKRQTGSINTLVWKHCDACPLWSEALCRNSKRSKGRSNTGKEVMTSWRGPDMEKQTGS